MDKKWSYSAIAAAVMLSGCATQVVDIANDENKALHQPQVGPLIIMESDIKPTQPTLTPEKRVTNASNPTQHQIPSFEPRDTPSSTEMDQVSIHASKSPYFDSNWDRMGLAKKISPFNVNRRQTNRETIEQWLSQEGFKVNFVLTRNDTNLLRKRTRIDDTYVETLPVALEKFISNMVVNESKKAPIHREQLTEHQLMVEGNTDNFHGLYISFDHNEATVFSVTKGMEFHYESENGPKTPAHQEFHMYRGETYEAALNRWITDAGYIRFGKLLSNETQQVLQQQIIHSTTIREPIEKSATLLLYKARNQAINDPRTERENFISTEDKANVTHHLYLDGEKKEAILTSSNQPVMMFNVQPGTLSENFVALATEFGWHADESHYLADQYRVSFGYPIVAERGNIKAALHTLLKDYVKLRGAVVPSTREAYIMMER